MVREKVDLLVLLSMPRSMIDGRDLAQSRKLPDWICSQSDQEEQFACNRDDCEYKFDK